VADRPANPGLADIPRSSGVGCPFHGDDFWHRLETDCPNEWAAAVAFDHTNRRSSARANANGQPPRGRFYYLHHCRVPLDEVVLRPRRGDAVEEPGCGPWLCPHTARVTDPVGEVA
jgi:hypothetical protein